MSQDFFPIFEAEHLLDCQNRLGESVTWDARRKLLHWVDIEKAEIHTLNDLTLAHSVEVYPDLGGIGCIVLKDDGDGFIGNSVHDLVLFPAPADPSPDSRTDREIDELLCTPVQPAIQTLPNSRLNDGACDRQGRYFTGNLIVPIDEWCGNLWRYEGHGRTTEMFAKVGISNGIDFSPDGNTMYYVDTVVLGVYQYDYNQTTGTPSNRRLFALSPFAAKEDRPMSGRFDGLCVDAQGNVWAAELGASAIVGWRADGSVICAITVPNCTTPTICCFGGSNLDVMYITSGHSSYANMGEVQQEYPWSGDLFKCDFRVGCEPRKLLGDSWSGGERNRYKQPPQL